MSIQAVSWVITHSKAKLAARLVLISIAQHADKDGANSFPSIATIAAEAALSTRQTQRVITQLERMGELLILGRRGGRGHCNCFTITLKGARICHPLEEKDDTVMSPITIKDDVTVSPINLERVTNRAIKGDVAVSPEPKEEPLEVRETANAVSGRSEERANGKSNGKGSRLPEGWQPRTEDIAFVAGLGLDPGLVTDEFCDFWYGVPGARGIKSDWNATYRNSGRRAAERAGARYRGNGFGGEPTARPGTIIHAVNAILSRGDLGRRER